MSQINTILEDFVVSSGLGLSSDSWGKKRPIFQSTTEHISFPVSEWLKLWPLKSDGKKYHFSYASNWKCLFSIIFEKKNPT